jgi:DNA-binding MarR family transcriptional regulator
MSSTDRPDLAALVVPLGRALSAAEEPILSRHGLTMWAYVVLLRLSSQPVRSQVALANAAGADKTRIIDVLDDLQARGLIDRRPDPDDRRVRLISITAKGRKVRDGAQRAIQKNEDRLLADIAPSDRRLLLDLLARCTAAVANLDG